MLNFIDRIPTFPNRKKITKQDGTIEYATIEYADEPTKNGTIINKYSMNKIQDLTNYNIKFYNDGRIEKIFIDNSKVITSFPENGNILQEYFDENSQKSLQKTIIFESDGTIRSEVVTFD